MEISAGIQASLAGRYASALFDLASEGGNVSAVESDLEKLGSALTDSRELAELIRNPQISRTDAAKAVSAIASLLGLDGLTTKFLGVLADNRRLGALPGMIRAFAAIAAAQRGEVTADVASARPLSDAQVASLQEKLKAREENPGVNPFVDPGACRAYAEAAAAGFDKRIAEEQAGQ